MTTETDSFFEESTLQSRVKAEIVAKYFVVWARIISATTQKTGGTRIAYLDLFAGPGRYADGTFSTPLRILTAVIADPLLRQMTVARFNDMAPSHANSLEEQIGNLPGIDSLKHPPKVTQEEVGAAFAEYFTAHGIVPSFVFLDPWGYKGLSLPLLRGMIKDWGCDCMFFFNFNRINMGITNPTVKPHMEAMFGATRLKQLAHDVEPLDSAARERMVLGALTDGLVEMGAEHVLPFRFKNDHGRTTHYLVFATKHFRGMERMRSIMAEHSTSITDGVAALEHSLEPPQPQLTLFDSPLEELKRHLVTAYAEQELSVRELFERDSVGRIYLAENYKEALRRLEAEGRLIANPPADQRPAPKGVRTMGDNTRVRFPAI